jgi:hypothetical protein
MEQNLLQTPPPKNWLVESILVTILCCLPFGIAGIVNASKVESRHFAGDLAGAQRAADEAKKWTKIGFFTALIGGVLYVIIMALFFGGMMKNPEMLDALKNK